MSPKQHRPSPVSAECAKLMLLELQGSKLLHAAEAMCQTDEACLEQTESVRGKAVLLDISHVSSLRSAIIAMFLAPAHV